MTKPMQLATLSITGCIAVLIVLATGCAERRTEYVPAYQSAPVYQAQPTYSYPPQATYQSQSPPPPLVTQGPAAADQPGSTIANAPQAPVAPVAVPTQPPPQTPPNVVVSQAPPPAQVEVVPVAPGPGYVWSPGYWGWNGGWVWIGGGWVVRPHPHAIWVGPHWVHRGHGYVYARGYWR